MKSINHRNALLKKAIKTKRRDARLGHNKYQIKLTRVIENIKTKFNHQVIENAGNDRKFRKLLVNC